MKKFLTLFVVLAIASMATALPVFISVDGVENPADSTIELLPSDHAVIDVSGFVAASQGEAIVAYMIVQGQGTITGGQVLQGDGGIYEFAPTDELDVAYTWADFMSEVGYAGVQSNILMIEIFDSSSPFTDIDGKIVDLIDFHCTGEGDAIISLLDSETLQPLDVQIIHQIPEPMTIALLGLGGLFLRRRK